MSYDAIRLAFENTEPVFLLSKTLQAVVSTIHSTDPLRSEFHWLEEESRQMDRDNAVQMSEWTARAEAAMATAQRRLM